MPAQLKIYPVVLGLLAGLLYVALTAFGSSQQTASESRLLLHPPKDLQGVYAGQLDRYVANELEVLLSREAVDATARSVQAQPDEVEKAATAAIEPGTDVVVLTVKGLGDGRDEAAAKSLVKAYTERSEQQARTTTEQPTKDLERRSAELETQIDDLSKKIARAQRSASRNTDPSVVAPVENSQRNLLVAQHGQLQEQLLQLQTEGKTAAPSVQVLSTANTVTESKGSLSPFNLGAAILGGAALGLLLALLHVGLRRRVGSWSEVETALRGRDWVAVGAAERHHGSSPLTDHLTRRMIERSAEGRSTLVEIVDRPGSAQVRRQAEDAAEAAGRVLPEGRVRIATTETTALSPDALCVIPYRKGALSKRDLSKLASHAPTDTSMVLAQVDGSSPRSTGDTRTA